MTNAESWITGLLAFIDSGAEEDALLETTVSVDSPELYRSGVSLFGSWDAALAASLVWLRNLDARAATSDDHAELRDIERPERRMTPASHSPLFVVSASGALLEFDLDRLAVTLDRALAPFPETPTAGHARADRLVLGGDDSSVVLVTTRGQAFAADSRLLQRWSEDTLIRDPSHRFSGLETDEVIATGLVRRHLRLSDRFYSVSVFGQIKATDAREYDRLSSDATAALLLKDGDALHAVFAGKRDAHVFVASSAGKAIHFPTEDVRSQGRRATGVRAIQLDPGARVVGAFATEGVDWVALSTEQGVMKRMPLTEYRPQGRSGGGLQTYRVSDDPVASVAALPIDGDVVVLTSRGRVTRFPAFDLPLGNRAAKGEPCIALEPGETVEQLLGVPAGSASEAG